MNISLLSKLWPLSSKQFLNDYTIKWYWKFRYSLLARKTFFSVSQSNIFKKNSFGWEKCTGKRKKKKVLLLFEKEFLSLSLSKFRKLEEKVVEIFDPWTVKQSKIWHKKTQIKSICDKNFSKELKKKSFLNFYWNKIVTST
jgi:hypothetical protein